jgi:hypothetical protein
MSTEELYLLTGNNLFYTSYVYTLVKQSHSTPMEWQGVEDV